MDAFLCLKMRDERYILAITTNVSLNALSKVTESQRRLIILNIIDTLMLVRHYQGKTPKIKLYLEHKIY